MSETELIAIVNDADKAVTWYDHFEDYKCKIRSDSKELQYPIWRRLEIEGSMVLKTLKERTGDTYRIRKNEKSNVESSGIYTFVWLEYKHLEYNVKEDFKGEYPVFMTSRDRVNGIPTTNIVYKIKYSDWSQLEYTSQKAVESKTGLRKMFNKAVNIHGIVRFLENDHPTSEKDDDRL